MLLRHGLAGLAGGNPFNVYAANGFTPPLVADFSKDTEFYGYDSAASTFDDMLTVSTTDLETMTDSDGLLKWNAHNQVINSQDFTLWDDLGASATANTTTAPDGTLTADTITSAGGTSRFRSITASIPATQRRIIACWFKYVDTQWVYLQADDGGGYVRTWFDIQNGVVGTTLFQSGGVLHEARITDTGNGWYLCEMEHTAVGGLVDDMVIIMSTADGVTTRASGDMYAWGAHYTRADLGGMVSNSDQTAAGLLSYVPTTAAAVYLPRRNAHLYDASVAKWNAHNQMPLSADLENAAWLGVDITGNGLVSGPLGTGTALQIIATASGSGFLAFYAGCGIAGVLDTLDGLDNRRGVVVSAASGITHVLLADDAAAFGWWFDIGTGVTGSKIGGGTAHRDPEITDLGGGAYYISVVWDETYIAASADKFALFFSTSETTTFTRTGSEAITLEAPRAYRNDLNGVVANGDIGTYVATTATAVEPTLNTVSFPKKGLRFESAAATNLITYSGDPSNAAWTKSFCAVGSEVAGGPTGTYRSLTSTTTAVGAAQAFQLGKTLTSGATYCVWAIVKNSDGSNWMAVNFNDGSGNRGWFDVQNGVKGTKDAGIDNYDIEDLGDGWYLAWVTGVSGSTSGGFSVDSVDSDGAVATDINDAILFAGAQMELGSVPSSYIPTSGATVTRPLETLSIAGAKTPANQTGMSFVVNGLMTYADNGLGAGSPNQQGEVVPMSWFTDSSNLIKLGLGTDSTNVGSPVAFNRVGGGANTAAYTINTYSPGVNVPFNWAASHGGAAIAAHWEGTAAAVPAAASTIADHSSTAVDLVYIFNGFLSEFIMFGADIEAAGRAEASTP